MKDRITQLFMLITLLVLANCKDDDKVQPTNSNVTCVIKSEATSLIGNEASWQYEYDTKGNPSSIKKYNAFGTLISTLEIFYNGVTNTASGANGDPVIVKTNYNSKFLEALPSQAHISITMDNIEQTNWKTYLFSYDDKNRLIKIRELTENIVGDYEWDMYISYNENNNVTSLQTELTTGPKNPINPITVKAYDNHPTPYAGVKSWKFLMANFGWDNYDPEPIFTALSQNNPLDYTLNNGVTIWERTMSYQYNEHGFPLQRTNTNKTSTGEYTFNQTFTYDCK